MPDDIPPTTDPPVRSSDVLGGGGKLTPDDLKQIEELIQKHKPSIPGGAGCLTILFLLFLAGCFKHCGY